MILCEIGLHNWDRWSEAEQKEEKWRWRDEPVKLNYYRQIRVCARCNLYESKKHD